MTVIAGLVILPAAVIADVAGVLANGGRAHPVTHFAVLGYHVTGSTSTVFLYGTVVSQQRDDLISQRDTARAYTVLDEQRNYTASTLGDGSLQADRDPRPGRPRRPAGAPAASAPAPAE
jgi:hypothetical protein